MKRTISIILALFIIVSAIFAMHFDSLAAESKTIIGKFNYTYAAEVLELVNKEREANGLEALTLTKGLTDGAMIRAAETTLSFSHTRPNGERCFTAFEWTSAAGENIAYGQTSPKQVMDGWMNSSGHRANILNASFTTIGIGCFEYNGRLYWSQAFSGGKGAAYSPSGTKDVTVEISLKSGDESKIISTQNDVSTTIKTTKSTTKSTTKTTTQTTTKLTTKASTTKKQTVSTKKSIYDLINSIINKYFRF